MSNTTANLQRKISSAGDLHSVVRAMKAMAASNISQYEKAALALDDYYHTVELGLSVCFPKDALASPQSKAETGGARPADVIVFGSDQGLVGRFNDVIADYAAEALAPPADETRVWAVGERVHTHLADMGIEAVASFSVPNSVNAVTALVGQLLLELEPRRAGAEARALYLIYNHPLSGATYAPVKERLLPLDDDWRRKLAALTWPTAVLPEVLGDVAATGRALIREYIFISLFRACSDSLASENASRLAAMQRADKNIGDLILNLDGAFHALRQSEIDEELFDVVSGFEALGGERQ